MLTRPAFVLGVLLLGLLAGCASTEQRSQEKAPGSGFADFVRIMGETPMMSTPPQQPAQQPLQPAPVPQPRTCRTWYQYGAGQWVTQCQ